MLIVTFFRKRIFLLGPSHHVHLNGIALSGFEKYETPIGDIPLCLDSESQFTDSRGKSGRWHGLTLCSNQEIAADGIVFRDERFHG